MRRGEVGFGAARGGLVAQESGKEGIGIDGWAEDVGQLCSIMMMAGMQRQTQL